MRRLLDALYFTSGVLAGVFLVAIAVFTLCQIGGRLLGFAALPFDEFAGYCLAASSFLGLAYTFRHNEHIRVSLLLERMPARMRRPSEIGCLLVASALLGFFAWHSLDMVRLSYQLHDMSQGLVAVPLWIPQIGMAAGVVVMFVAVVDDLIVALGGRDPSYRLAEKRKQVALSENI